MAKEQFEKLGFEMTLRLVTTEHDVHEVLRIPAADVASCPSAAWGKDFSDGQTILDPIFNGDNITKQANNNYAELDVPAINDEMDAAKLLTDPKERAAAWGKADRDITAAGAWRPVAVGQEAEHPVGQRQRRRERSGTPPGISNWTSIK